MRYLCIIFILKLFLNDTWGRVKLTKIKNLTQELQYYGIENIVHELVRYEATLLHLKDEKRIIGGHPVHIKHHPSTAYLLLIYSWSWNFRGGAIIIGRFWAVTAGHCLKHIPADSIRQNKAFVCGNTSNWKKGCNKHRIIKKYVHEKYNDKEVDYDIGLVRVMNPFNGRFEKPIKWANRNYKYINNAYALVLGWGSTHPKKEIVSDVLRGATIQLVNQNKCITKHAKSGSLVTNRMFCATAKGKDACVFDSGGPLIRNKILIGIISWGPTGSCAQSNLPGVYTKVAFFDDWLRKKMGIRPKRRRTTECDLLSSNVTNGKIKCAH